MTQTMKKIVTRGVPLGLMLFATVASAQIYPAATVFPDPAGPNAAFPKQNINGPTGTARQVNYPYPGQCLASSANANLFPLLAGNLCAGGSFSAYQRTASDWADASGATVPFSLLNAVIPNSLPLAGTLPTPKFQWNVLNPIDYTPDKRAYPGADYYEIGLHEAWGFQALADAAPAAFNAPLTASLFPNAKINVTCGAGRNVACTVPNGMQWTGLICTAAAGCSCPADASATFKAMYCVAGTATKPLIPQGLPLLTPIWGVGQINQGKDALGAAAVIAPGFQSIAGGPVTTIANAVHGCSLKPTTQCATTPTDTCVAAGLGTCQPLFDPLLQPGTTNGYIATWPSISIRAQTGTPVVVKWANQFPNNHVLCPHPEAADWPCAIDRTFMGVKSRVDPAFATGTVPADAVNRYGSPQQPDNSWVTHLHGGEIPPSTDGFAEKWYGNSVTAAAYTNLFVSPPFENPSFITLKRPAGSADIYTYPMVQEEATIWFHDHTLGKTHHNVIAGPAGFFPVKEPLKHGPVASGVCSAGQNCTYTWLDPVTEPRDAIGTPLYDLFLAVQDRSFNDDGSINFSNGLGQVIPPVAPALLPLGYTPVTPGVNPQVHPTWIPEYFGDHVLVNGVLWPKKPVAAGWYRLRIVDGSDSRCYTVGFAAQVAAPAPGAKVANNVPFFVIANDQGYLARPVKAPGNQFTMCPGERYELLVNFGVLPGFAAGTGTVYMTNSAPAPFPAGITPQAAASPYAEMNVIMRFDVAGAGIGTCTGAAVPNGGATYTLPAGFSSSSAAPGNCLPDPALYGVDPSFVDLRPVGPLPAGSVVRQVYLNERVDGVTLAPMGMQLNGVPFEYKVTETPKKGTKEYWQFINLTVDAHPMHPHLVSHQIVSRQNFKVGQYKALLCGSTTCQPGTTPGGEMQVVPDVTPLLTGAPVLVTKASVEGGRKDASQVPPGMVTTIVAEWKSRWPSAGCTGSGANYVCAVGSAPNATTPALGSSAAGWSYDDVTSGPYVWHCHINSHEDSEMMRSSLVVP